MDNNSVGTIIRKARRAKRLSQKALSDLCGISHAQISNIETGKSRPHLLTLKLICDCLALDFNEVLIKAGYNSMDDSSLGTKIKNARLAKRLSQQALSDLSGIARPYLSKIENNKAKPKTSTLRLMYKFLDLDFEKL